MKKTEKTVLKNGLYGMKSSTTTVTYVYRYWIIYSSMFYYITLAFFNLHTNLVLTLKNMIFFRRSKDCFKKNWLFKPILLNVINFTMLLS